MSKREFRRFIRDLAHRMRKENCHKKFANLLLDVTKDYNQNAREALRQHKKREHTNEHDVK